VLSGLPSSFIPTLSGQVRAYNDNTKRLTFDNESMVRQSLNKVADRIPGLAQRLPADYTTLGKTAEKFQDDSNSFFNVFLNPAFVSKYKPDEDAKAAIDFYKQTGSKVSAPRVPDKSIDLDGKSVKLNKENFSELKRITGQKQKEYLQFYREVLMNKEIPKESLTKLYENTLTDANKAAREEFIQKYKNKVGR
jgi:hypothetical protein